VGVDGSSLVRVLDILAREGLIERRRDEADGRARLIHLTKTGEARVAEIRRELAIVERALLVDIADDELGLMLEHIAKIEGRLAELEDQRAGASE
jgi:MarR family transcriptional regulator for hemolysin